MRRAFLILALLSIGVLPHLALGQGTPAGPAKAPTKGPLVPADIARKLYEIGFPAVGENADFGVAQWRAKTGRKTIGTLSAEELAAIRAETLPATFGAFLGHPFTGYGFAIRQKTRADATALALDECRKTNGPACEPGKQIVFTGQRCIAVAGYRDEVGADGKSYTAFSAYVGDKAEIATATAMRNCATDADGQKHCKPLFVRCADGGPSQSTPASPSPAPTPAPPAPAVAPPPPTMAEIASKLFVLGFPVSGKATDNPMAAISQWRFRTVGKPGSDPLSPDEIRTIMSTPRPADYGAFAGTTFSGYGFATQRTSREQAEAEAITQCLQAKGADCEKSPPMVVTGTRCIAYAGYLNELKADGKRHTLSASGLADDPSAAMRIAVSRCSEQPDNAPLCKSLVVACADGRQIEVARPATAPAASPTPPSPPPLSPVPPPVAARPSPDVMNKLYALGYPTVGRPYDDPAIAISEWRVQRQHPTQGSLTQEESAAILSTPDPKSYFGFVGDPLGIHGIAALRETRARAEVDAIAECRQRRGNCDDTPAVVAGDRCLAFAGFKEEAVPIPRSMRASGVGADAVEAKARAMKRCGERAVDAALCKPLVAFCADGRQP